MTLIGVFLCTSLAQAQNSTQVADTLELDPITVTASKIPLTARETTKPVLVITRAEIERSAGRDIAQVLNAQSGLVINNAYGNPSSNKGVFLQGASAQYTLILVDGIAINDPSGSGGAYDIRLLPLSNVERIEIVKGSQSTLYGTDAIAGVINIITKKGSSNPFNINGSASYGAFNSFQGALGVSGAVDENFGYSVQYSRESTDGINEATDRNNAGGFDEDGFSQDALLVKFNIKSANGLTVSPFLNYTFYDGEFDAGAFTDGNNTFELTTLNPGAQFTYQSGLLRVNGGYQYTRTERTFVSPGSTFNAEGQFHNADVYGTYVLEGGLQLLGGLNYQSNVLPNAGNQVSSQIFSPYATLFIRNENGFNAELGARLNSHTEYGTNFVFSVSPSFNVNEQVKLLASVSTGFKAPTVNELFGPFGANLDLDPQRSFSIDAGVELTLIENALSADVHYFNRSIDDVITFLFPGGFVNLNEQNDYGFEVNTRWVINPSVTARAYYNFLEGETVTPTRTVTTLIRRPKHQVGLGLDVIPVENLFVSVTGTITGERPDTDFSTGNTVILDDFTLFNFYAEYKIMDGQITIFGDVKNAFDTDYTEAFGFNTIGVAAKGGIRFNIK